jgi:hypothetical protein
MSQRIPIEARLLAANVAINNAIGDAGIQEVLTLFGYNQTKLNAGLALLAQAEAEVNRHKVEYGEQYEASQTLAATWEAAKAPYARTLAVARVAFKGNPKADAALMLKGDRRNSLSGWLEQAEALYGNLTSQPDLLEDLSGFGYDLPKVAAEYDLVQAVKEANLAQEAEKGDAQQATKDRDAAIDALDDWMADFKQIAIAALSDAPQQLEKLGFGAVA